MTPSGLDPQGSQSPFRISGVPRDKEDPSSISLRCWVTGRPVYILTKDPRVMISHRGSHRGHPRPGRRVLRVETSVFGSVQRCPSRLQPPRLTDSSRTGHPPHRSDPFFDGHCPTGRGRGEGMVRGGRFRRCTVRTRSVSVGVSCRPWSFPRSYSHNGSVRYVPGSDRDLYTLPRPFQLTVPPFLFSGVISSTSRPSLPVGRGSKGGGVWS